MRPMDVDQLLARASQELTHSIYANVAMPDEARALHVERARVSAFVALVTMIDDERKIGGLFDALRRLAFSADARIEGELSRS